MNDPTTEALPSPRFRFDRLKIPWADACGLMVTSDVNVPPSRVFTTCSCGGWASTADVVANRASANTHEVKRWRTCLYHHVVLNPPNDARGIIARNYMPHGNG